MFSPDEVYLTLGEWEHQPGPGTDYTGQDVYFRSVQERADDVLTTLDYLWRWDTDWFWCSRAFGAQHPVVRRVWPRRWRRSDVYHRLVGLEHRFGVYAKVQRLRGRPDVERVVQDVEIPVGRVADFLRWFDAHVGMRPVWLCPLRLREPGGPGSARTWPLYPLAPGRYYVNIGFWGAVPIAAGAEDGDVNRAIERAVAEHGGHKSLYSDAYYSREDFDRLYDGPQPREGPGGPRPGRTTDRSLREGGDTTMTTTQDPRAREQRAVPRVTVGEALASVVPTGCRSGSRRTTAARRARRTRRSGCTWPPRAGCPTC